MNDTSTSGTSTSFLPFLYTTTQCGLTAAPLYQGCSSAPVLLLYRSFLASVSSEDRWPGSSSLPSHGRRMAGGRRGASRGGEGGVGKSGTWPRSLFRPKTKVARRPHYLLPSHLSLAPYRSPSPHAFRLTCNTHSLSASPVYTRAGADGRMDGRRRAVSPIPSIPRLASPPARHEPRRHKSSITLLLARHANSSRFVSIHPICCRCTCVKE